MFRNALNYSSLPINVQNQLLSIQLHLKTGMPATEFGIKISKDKNDAGGSIASSKTKSCASFIDEDSTTTTGMSVKTKQKKHAGKSSYRHVPHSQKPPQVVARRNARERRRVQAVNNAFLRLRKHVPYHSKHKRLSKVKTLKIAIDYIHELQSLLSEFDKRSTRFVAENNSMVLNSNGYFSYPNEIRFPSDKRRAFGSVSRNRCLKSWEVENVQQNSGTPAQVPSHMNSDDQCCLPEYGSLGMTEITRLPDL